MGQKVNPIGLRLGITERWKSFWFADDKNFKDFLREDVEMRKYLFDRFPRGSVTRVDIEKIAEKVKITLYSPRPGVVLGRKGAEINAVREEVYNAIKKQVMIDVNEIKNPGQDAQFVADSIAMQLERRVPHRIAVKKAMALSLQTGALGIKVRVGGRLGGAEISRSELYIKGKVPLHTLRAKISYATSTAITKFGCIGVKVWIFLGEVFEKSQQVSEPANAGISQADGEKLSTRSSKNAINAEKGKIQEVSEGQHQR
ncbi:MAG: 30S ribosomal protein S3 [Candidatus Omnitrophica bacterium]|nr:30S ribosomal protein S3 [Candidatus Omnitrophota bacterium]MCM8788638.1 30S ribosomal protein S3 [Candidatus Omnitrophota bacterium]